MLFFPTVDEDVQYFRSQGYTGSINDMHFKAMGDLGYTGSLNDRIHSYLTFKYGSYYEAMRNLRNGTSVFSLISAYAVNGFDPALVFDFVGNYFRKGSEDSTLASATTYTGASNGTMTDGYGAELVTNGTFDTDVAGWAVLFGSVSWLSGKLHLVQDGGDASTARAYQGVATEIGKTYIITADVGAVSIGNASIVASTSTNNGGFPVVSSSGNETVELVFVAAATTTNVILNVSGSSARTADFDNISVREMPVIKWKPHNLLPYSEDFSNAAWTKANTATLALDAVGPDGATSATTLVDSSAGGSGSVSITETALTVATSATYTYSLFAKADQLSWFNLGARNFTTPANSVAFFDLSTGVTGTVSSGLTANIEDVGGGWYHCSITFTTGAADTFGDLRVELADANNDFFVDLDGTSSILIYGAQFYRSDLGGMVNNPAQPAGLETYVPTTSAAVYLPRVGNHVYNGSAWVNEGLLLESEARTNLLTYSEDFSNAAWIDSIPVIVTADQAVSPDGTQNADSVELVSNGDYTYQLSAVSASTQYSFSWYIKAGTATVHVYGFYDQSNAAWVDQTKYTITDGESVGNGWYRVTKTVTTPVGCTSLRIYPLRTNDSVGYDPDTIGTSILYGAQLEQASTPSSYIPTAGATVTRAAETLTVPAANMPWPTPVEVTGTELVTNGTFDTDISGWTFDNSDPTAVTSTWNAAGYMGIARGSGSTAGFPYQAVPVTAGLVYVVTVTNTLSNYALRIGSGVGWDDLVRDDSFQGTSTYYLVPSTSSIFIGGWPSSNNTSSSLDNVSVKEINPLSVSIQMDGRVTYADGGSSETAIHYRWFADGNNRIQGYLGTSGTATGQPIWSSKAAGVAEYSTGSTTYYSPDVNVPFNISSRHGSTFINGAVDGVALTANTTPVALPDLSATDFKVGFKFMGNIGGLRVWADDLGDTGIAEATLPSTEPSLSLTFDGSETSFTVLDWSE